MADCGPSLAIEHEKKGGLPSGSMLKNPSDNAGDSRDMGLIPGLGRALGVLLPGESHRQRTLVGCSPWSHRESDTTEQLNTHTHTHTHTEADEHLSSQGRREESLPHVLALPFKV